MKEMMNEVKFPPKIRKVNIFNVNVKRRDIGLSNEIQAPRFLGTPHNRTVHRSVPLFALTAQDSPRSSPLKDIKEELFPRPSQHSSRRADEHEWSARTRGSRAPRVGGAHEMSCFPSPAQRNCVRHWIQRDVHQPGYFPEYHWANDFVRTVALGSRGRLSRQLRLVIVN